MNASVMDHDRELGPVAGMDDFISKPASEEDSRILVEKTGVRSETPAALAMETIKVVNRRILVIDDNPAIHDDFRKILAGKSNEGNRLTEIEDGLFGESSHQAAVEGFEIDSAYQGEEGLKCVRQTLSEGRPYAMAFVDVRMPPGWDGVETVARIWRDYPDVQIVICTAYSDYSWDDMMAKLGQTDRLVILKKPFDSMEASQLAHALTSKWQLLQQAKQKLSDLKTVVQARTADLTIANQRLTAEIIERKHSEHERQMMEVQLRQSQKLEAIGQMAAGVAHEINTPLQYVSDNTRFLQDAFAGINTVLATHKMLIETCKNGALTTATIAEAEAGFAAGDMEYLCAQIPAAIEETLAGVGRVTKIVRAMKEFSHPGSTEKAAADLNRAIESTVTVAHNEWKYVAEVKLELSPDLPPVWCFIGEFNQCILNLLVNAAHAIGDAVKATPGSMGTITIKTLRDGNFVEVRVTDTGTGIPESARPHIFEPFFTTKDVGKGTGQGLSIIYGSIVKRHEGTVRFETETGRGTSFILRLPIGR
jgi:two-component system NtrC family sensor kinase